MNICERHNRAQRVWREKMKGSDTLSISGKVAKWFSTTNATIAEFFNPTLSPKSVHFCDKPIMHTYESLIPIQEPTVIRRIPVNMDPRPTIPSSDVIMEIRVRQRCEDRYRMMGRFKKCQHVLG